MCIKAASVNGLLDCPNLGFPYHYLHTFMIFRFGAALSASHENECWSGCKHCFYAEISYLNVFRHKENDLKLLLLHISLKLIVSELKSLPGKVYLMCLGSDAVSMKDLYSCHKWLQGPLVLQGTGLCCSEWYLRRSRRKIGGNDRKQLSEDHVQLQAVQCFQLELI